MKEWRNDFKDSADLTKQDVFVIGSTLESLSPRVQEYSDLLSAAEAERADRFKFQIHRDRFIASHGLVREVLGFLLRVPAHDLEFSEGEFGKPFLSGDFAGSEIQFNLSRSENRIVLAVARARKVGVDVEFVRPNLADSGVAQTHFSIREFEDLNRLTGRDWEIGFFNCWTRNEAFIKATGEGLNRPLGSIDVTLRPGQPAELTSVDSDPEETKRWKLVDLPFENGCAGALVAEGRDWNLTCWNYPS